MKRNSNGNVKKEPALGPVPWSTALLDRRVAVGVHHEADSPQAIGAVVIRLTGVRNDAVVRGYQTPTPVPLLININIESHGYL